MIQDRFGLDQRDEGRKALKAMSRLVRNHLMLRLLNLLDDYEFQPTNRNEPYLKIGIYECPMGRYACKAIEEADKFGAASATQRAVVECLLNVGLSHDYIEREENKIPFAYKLTPKGKRALKVRASSRSSLIGGLIIEKSRNADAGK